MSFGVFREDKVEDSGLCKTIVETIQKIEVVWNAGLETGCHLRWIKRALKRRMRVGGVGDGISY